MPNYIIHKLVRGKPTLRGGSILDLPFDMFRETIDNMSNDLEGLKGIMLSSRLSPEKYKYAKQVYDRAYENWKKTATEEFKDLMRRVREFYTLSNLNYIHNTSTEIFSEINKLRNELEYFDAQHPEWSTSISKMMANLERAEEKIGRKIV